VDISRGECCFQGIARLSIRCVKKRERGIRRKDTFSLGTKKRNGRSPARWRKVGYSQALTEAKETLRAIAALAIPVHSDVPWLNVVRLPSTGLFSLLLSSLLFSSLLFASTAYRADTSLFLSSSLRTDRSRKIITDGWSFNRKALGRATSGTWRLIFIQELCTDCISIVHCLKKKKKMRENAFNSSSLLYDHWENIVFIDDNTIITYC